MTDINELTGPALDAAVAREVMGWEPDEYAGSLDFAPSTDHNDLHRVIEHMRERKWCATFLVTPRGFWQATFTRNPAMCPRFVDDQSFNTAVLRACLEAVRSEKQ